MWKDDTTRAQKRLSEVKLTVAMAQLWVTLTKCADEIQALVHAAKRSNEISADSVRTQELQVRLASFQLHDTDKNNRKLFLEYQQQKALRQIGAKSYAIGKSSGIE